MPRDLNGIGYGEEHPALGFIVFTLDGKIHESYFCKVCVKDTESRYCDGSRIVNFDAEAQCTHVSGDE